MGALQEALLPIKELAMTQAETILALGHQVLALKDYVADVELQTMGYKNSTSTKLQVIAFILNIISI